jgi:hypothetical protein
MVAYERAGGEPGMASSVQVVPSKTHVSFRLAPLAFSPPKSTRVPPAVVVHVPPTQLRAPAHAPSTQQA